jgi:hypothetical protein
MQSHRAVLIAGIISLGMVTTAVSQSHTQATSNPKGTGNVAAQTVAMPNGTPSDVLSTLIFLTGQ